MEINMLCRERRFAISVLSKTVSGSHPPGRDGRRIRLRPRSCVFPRSCHRAHQSLAPPELEKHPALVKDAIAKESRQTGRGLAARPPRRVPSTSDFSMVPPVSPVILAAGESAESIRPMFTVQDFPRSATRVCPRGTGNPAPLPFRRPPKGAACIGL